MSTDRAGRYLRELIAREGQQMGPAEAEHALAETVQLAELDWAACRNNASAKAAVCVAVVDAHILRDHAHGLPLTPLKAVRDFLVGAATGRPGGLELPPGVPGARASVDDLYAKVVFSMLWEKYPESRQTLARDAARLFGKTQAQVKNMPANMRSTVRDDPHASRLRQHAEEEHRRTGSRSIGDYVASSSP